jgi:predicted amidophosphoribosyltransferase
MMIICPVCTLATYPDRDACHQCGARLTGPVEPRWRLRYRLPNGTTGVLSTTEPYDTIVIQLARYYAQSTMATWLAVPVDEDAWRKRRQQEEHGVTA